ncbi:hypothetical protein CHS0354_014942 [Potamilus streckersoni]|uniref:Uncharacterized protein n=1 Tax=Potamilus streckersoni TaxID=2493646 RepID=A0AAE0VS39_9BIVA|nr:hypothetical protein CHS0354_014942 [Potamilus streckersoni]
MRTTEGIPICNFCHGIGHMERPCLEKYSTVRSKPNLYLDKSVVVSLRSGESLRTEVRQIIKPQVRNVVSATGRSLCIGVLPVNKSKEETKRKKSYSLNLIKQLKFRSVQNIIREQEVKTSKLLYSFRDILPTIDKDLVRRQWRNNDRYGG